ncbi:MAG TPA: sulfatase-like hydrolase/transferase [Thermoanaerobaculia bacterium]|nr:sulfatase-like hydrolase/transferase [Thermoanaerobaculia bacterium]
MILGALILAARIAAPASAPRPSIVLITLDTFRADHVGAQLGGKTLTPNLDALARGGTRYLRALAPAPLTLPAHCSLMTGLDPPAHGVRDNGASALPDDVPTLAAALAAGGYATAAFVGSRVLDHRFGLDRGFAVYDDAMTAEEVGEQGYPERRAAAVTDAALAWAERRPAGRPFFLWVHYYDAHAPYEAPGAPKAAPAAERYAAEVSYVDREAGRLLARLRSVSPSLLIAAAGDHGEMLGEHGEKEHGIFLYRSALEVPLILAGAGVPRGATVADPVGTRALAATLLRLAGSRADARRFGAGLPGLASSDGAAPEAVYSETWLPATAYGWSPLQSVDSGPLRLIRAPRSELYDREADPSEARNLFSSRPDDARRLARLLERAAAATQRTAPPPRGSAAEKAELAASLRSLGYLSGASGRSGTIDPKDGVAMLAEFDAAREAMRVGRAHDAMTKLRELVRRSPDSVPFLTRLAEAEVAAGETAAGLETIRRAVALNPRLDLLHTSAGELYARAGQPVEARREWETALALNPRAAPAWLGLAQLAAESSPPRDELAILSRAEQAGTRSAAIQERMARLELEAKRTDAAGRHAEEAIRLLPDFAEAWWTAGEVSERTGRRPEALERYEKAIGLGFEDPAALLLVGGLLVEDGRRDAARPYLERAIARSPGTEIAQRARELLADR